MKHAGSFMSPPITIKSESSLSDVLRKIIDEKKSRLLVSDGGVIKGIVSEKDLGLFLLTDNTERKLDEIPLNEIFKKLIFVDEKTNLVHCAELMLTHEIGSLAVTSNGQVSGILTKTDLVKYFAKTHSGKKTVGEYMSPYYAWQYSDAPLYQLVIKMINDRISRIIIRDHTETPVGIVAFRDLFVHALRLGQQEDVLDNTDPLVSIIFPRKGFISESGFGGTIKAHDVMNPNIISVNYDDDLAKTGELLLKNQINGAGVLSGHGNMIGIISKTDIVKALAFLK